MPTEYRSVTVAAGHTVNVRRAPKQTERPGYVRVIRSHFPPFDVRESLWKEAPRAHG